MLVTSRHRNIEALFAEFISQPLELLIFRDFNRTGVGFALKFARWIFYISLHQFPDRVADRYHDPCALGEVVHEDVVALLGILPEIENLWDSGNVFVRAFPSKIAVDRQAAGRLPVITT